MSRPELSTIPNSSTPRVNRSTRTIDRVLDRHRRPLAVDTYHTIGHKEAPYSSPERCGRAAGARLATVSPQHEKEGYIGGEQKYGTTNRIETAPQQSMSRWLLDCFIAGNYGQET